LLNLQVGGEGKSTIKIQGEVRERDRGQENFVIKKKEEKKIMIAKGDCIKIRV